MIGYDISTSGVFNAGVRGLSVRGAGVAGQSGTGAVAASSNIDGVFGTSSGGGTSVGVEGFSGPVGLSGGLAGVQGNNNLTSIAVRANGFGGNLFVGNNSLGTDVFTVDNGGNVVIAGHTQINSSENVTGDVGAGSVFAGSGNVTVGGSFQGNTAALEGTLTGTLASPKAGVQGDNTSDVTSIAVRANGTGGLLFDGNSSSSTDVFVVDNFGNVKITGLITTGGSCSIGCARSASDPGMHVTSYAPRESEPSMEDYGEAQLVGGQAYVHLDPAFANVIDQRSNYLVFVTPEGDNRGLYVTQKSSIGFAVRESQGGRSTLAFSYRIVAKPFGVRAPRLPMSALLSTPKFSPALGMRTHIAVSPVRLNHVPKRGLIVAP